MELWAKRATAFLGIIGSLLAFLLIPDWESVSAYPGRGFDLRVLVIQEGGTLAGDAGDADSTTFAFADDSQPRTLVQRDGVTILAAQVPGLYGSSDGMTIFDQGMDVTSVLYSGFGGQKTPVGADLSDAMGWPHILVSPGQVAIDPVLGRFQFHGGDIPDLLARWDVSGNAHDGICVSGNYAYLTDWLRGFDIVDISDPEHPVFQSNLPLTGNGMDVIVDDGFAYVTTKSGGLHIVDVHDPLHPVQLGSIQADPEVDDLALHLHKADDLIFVADEMYGVPIYDVSDPNHPFKIGTCGISFGEAVWVEDNYAYLTGGTVGLHIYDVSDPSNPQFVSSLPKISYTYDVQVWGDHAYVAEAYAGLRVIDVSDPFNPTDVALIPTASEAYDVQIAHGFAYVAERQSPGHIEIFDLSDPASPTLAKVYESSQQVNGLYPVGSLVYAAGHARGLLVIQPNVSEAPTGPVTVDYNWVDVSVTPTPLPTADPSRPVTLTLQISLQGRGAAPSASWQVPISVSIEEPGGAGIVLTGTHTCDTTGQLRFSDVAQGDYEIRVKKMGSLVNVRYDFAARADGSVDMDFLVDGDCNEDERINVLDFSLIASSFGADRGEAGFDPRCDLNGDNVVNILDFSLFAANYDMIGPREITSP